MDAPHWHTPRGVDRSSQTGAGPTPFNTSSPAYTPDPQHVLSAQETTHFTDSQKEQS
jgi:hypothetical protein